MNPGDESGLLEAIEPIKSGKFWLCRCSCGNTTKVSRWHFEKGKRKSCGCRRAKRVSQAKCKKCGKIKDINEFYLRRNGRVNAYVCKSCYKPILLEAKKRRDKESRLKALQYYGGNPPSCECCGETNIEFLSFDHINGGGNKHRQTLSKGDASRFYRWLEKNEYPDEYRILCRNCNFSIGAYGYCPHSHDSR